MANPVITNLDGSNPGPAGVLTVNTQTPYSDYQFIQTIGVSLTPVAALTITAAEQSFGLNGVSFVSAATGIKPGDIILSVNAPSDVAGVTLASYRVDPTVVDKFYIKFVNPTGASATPASGVYTVTVARPNLSNSPILPTAIV